MPSLTITVSSYFMPHKVSEQLMLFGALTNFGVSITFRSVDVFRDFDKFCISGLTKTPENQSQNNLAESSPKKSSKKKNELLSCCASGGEDIELLGQGMGSLH